MSEFGNLEDERMRRWENERLRWLEDGKMRRCEDERMREQEDGGMRGCENESIRGWWTYPRLQDINKPTLSPSIYMYIYSTLHHLPPSLCSSKPDTNSQLTYSYRLFSICSKTGFKRVYFPTSYFCIEQNIFPIGNSRNYDT